MNRNKTIVLEPRPRMTLNALLDPRRKIPYHGHNMLRGNGWYASKAFTVRSSPLGYLDGISNPQVTTVGFFRCEDFGFNGQVGFNMLMRKAEQFPYLGLVSGDILEQLLFEMLEEGRYPSEWNSLLPHEPLVLIGTTGQKPQAVPLLTFHPKGAGDSQDPVIWLETDLTINGKGIKQHYYLFMQTEI